MTESKTNSKPPPSVEAESVWTYRGYRMKPGEFNMAMIHFYRGELSRSNVWRTRLDSTTNWAVVTTGAVLLCAVAPSEISRLKQLVYTLAQTINQICLETIFGTLSATILEWSAAILSTTNC